MLSVIVPANNEAGYIGTCIEALLASTIRDPAEIVIVANGCVDGTADAARAFAEKAAARGWRFVVLDLREGGKLNALNAGDAIATGDMRAYVDADIVVSPELLGQIVAALDRPEPAYASGRAVLSRPRSWVSRAYVRFWSRVPFNRKGVAGYGVFAVNAAGRARWGAFPIIISDDTYVRLHFAPSERHAVPATYAFPLPEGFRRLVRVRRRQNLGVDEVADQWPALLRNDDKEPFGARAALREGLADPIAFLVYAAISFAARVGAARHAGVWARGR